jgi:hypothetical protein
LVLLTEALSFSASVGSGLPKREIIDQAAQGGAQQKIVTEELRGAATGSTMRFRFYFTLDVGNVTFGVLPCAPTRRKRT